MAHPLLRLDVGVYPDYGIFRVHDPNAPFTDPQDLPASPGGLIHAGTDQLWVISGQANVTVRLLLEEWPHHPTRGLHHPEAQACTDLHLHGAIAVTETTTGPAVHGLRLHAGNRLYHLRIQAENRTDTARRYDDLFTHYEVSSPEFTHARTELELHERYLIQLWPVPHEPNGAVALAGPGVGLTDRA